MPREHKKKLLALYPVPRGYAFALFESGTKLIDWGLRDFRCKSAERNAESLADIEALMGRLDPTSIVLEDTTEPDSRRAPRIKRLSRSIVLAAQKRGIPVRLVTKQELATEFTSQAEGAKTKYEIAQEVAKRFPALGCRLPRQRHIWESEPVVMGLFAAAALGLAACQTDC